VSDLAVEVRGLVKRFGDVEAVRGIDLDVLAGETFGFLGPNGAGKSTSIKMLLGLVRATGGSARVLGRSPGDTPTLARIGFLPEHFRFHDWLTARELLALHGRLERMEPAHCRKRTVEVLELVGLAEHADRSLSGFSKGMLQRIGIAQALLHSPELIFMDEPTSALDPFGRRLVRTIIQQVKAQGTTVFLNSHLLSEVEVTCDRVAFIRDGIVLQTLGLHEMQSGKQHLELRVDAVSPALLERLAPLVDEWRFLDTDNAPASAAAGTVGEMSMPDGAGDGAPTALMLVTDAMRAPLIAQATLDAGAQLHALIPRHTSLEQLFLDVVGMEDSGQ
jgi:ABC-2 type transport system ATP-binding protein